MMSLLADLRSALRLLARSPGFTAVAVATLALGIGANLALFAVLDAVLLRPLPYARPDELVLLWQTQPGNAERPVAPANFLDWRRQARSFAGMASYSVRSQHLQAAEPLRPGTAIVSASFFEVL